MLHAIPRSMFTWNYRIEDGRRNAIAEVDVAWMRERGQFHVNGDAYDVYRQGWVSGDFLLERDRVVVCRAVKPSAFRRSFDVKYADRRLTLEAAGLLGRSYILREGNRQLGAVTATGWFTHRANVDLPKTFLWQSASSCSGWC